MDARPGSVLDDDTDQDLGTALAKGSEEDSGGTEKSAEQSTSFFDKDFDPSTLEAPLQGQYKQMEAAFNERMSQLPDSEVMQSIGMKSQAFDRLVAMPQFQKWAEGMTGSEPSAGRKAAAEVDDQTFLEGLDPDVQEGIRNLVQRSVDEAVTSKVTPLSDAFFSQQADATIDAIKEVHGEETFNRLVPQMTHLMEVTDGLDLEGAFKMARFDELNAELEKRQQQVIREKNDANMLGDGSFETQPSALPKVKNAMDAIRLGMKMVGENHPQAFDPMSLPPGYRGE
jgi:hypothetical protein